MAHWRLSGVEMHGEDPITFSLYRGSKRVCGGSYNECYDHVIDNGDDGDTYAEPLMMLPCTVAHMRSVRAAKLARIAREMGRG